MTTAEFENFRDISDFRKAVPCFDECGKWKLNRKERYDQSGGSLAVSSKAVRGNEDGGQRERISKAS